SRDCRPLVLGGGHETAWGSFAGILVAARPDWRIGVINVDAHFDLRADSRPFHYLCLGVSEASNTAALFERADYLGADWRLDTDLAPWKLEEPLAAVE